MLLNNVKQLRLQQGWTHEQLADRLSVSRQTVSSIENLRWMPSLEMAFKIAELFGKPVGEVFYRDESK